MLVKICFFYSPGGARNLCSWIPNPAPNLNARKGDHGKNKLRSPEQILFLGGGGGVPLSEQDDDPTGDFHSINVPGQQQATDSLALETGILG